jgi:hypothetical protein
VSHGWRPYWQGQWTYTPRGLYWVTGDPWGPIPYHYGSWSLDPYYGWIWYPGYAFSPAHVVWYWGPHFTAWIPSGFYFHYYGRYGFWRYPYGVFGWAGGGFGHYRHWTFCPYRYFGGPYQRHHYQHAGEIEHRYGTSALPPGIIATDTRTIDPSRWGSPGAIRQALLGENGESDRRPGSPLLDLTPFIGRHPELPPEIIEQVRNPRRVLPRPSGQGDVGTSSRGGWPSSPGRDPAAHDEPVTPGYDRPRPAVPLPFDRDSPRGIDRLPTLPRAPGASTGQPGAEPPGLYRRPADLPRNPGLRPAPGERTSGRQPSPPQPLGFERPTTGAIPHAPRIQRPPGGLTPSTRPPAGLSSPKPPSGQRAPGLTRAQSGGSRGPSGLARPGQARPGLAQPGPSRPGSQPRSASSRPH